MSQCYILANLVEICRPVHEILCTQATFWLKFGSLSPAVTLKIRSRSPKPNQLFIMSQCYIRANLVKIHPPVHEYSCIQESVTPTPTPTGSAPKTICPLPFGGGHNKSNTTKYKKKRSYENPVIQEVELRNRTVTSRYGNLQYPCVIRKWPKLSTYRFPACLTSRGRHK